MVAGTLVGDLAKGTCVVSIPDWSEFRERSRKPVDRQIGNWFARHVSRPMALPVTWVLLPTGISAHAVTLITWATGMAAAGSFACGGSAGWLVGAALLELWYLLDHVDGQIARCRGCETLDGVALDYLMHHAVHVAVPCGIGLGLSSGASSAWAGVGMAWGLALLVIGLEHDVRAKAFLQRLKRLDGTLDAIGGGGGRPAPAPAIPRGWLPRLRWLARKSCEMHIVMNVLAAVALATWLCEGLAPARSSMAALLALAAVTVAAVQVGRNLRHETAERDFAAWFRPPAGTTLVYQDGMWKSSAGPK